MAKLSQREVDAVVETVISKIREFHANSPEQVAYEKQLKIQESLDKECESESRRVIKELMIQYQEKYPNMEFSIYDYYNRLDVEKPKAPSYSVNNRDIERELIVANISGDIEETMDKLVNKYTSK